MRCDGFNGNHVRFMKNPTTRPRRCCIYLLCGGRKKCAASNRRYAFSGDAQKLWPDVKVLSMSSAETVESILQGGAERGFQNLTPTERNVWLISEAEVLCDMEGIDAFSDGLSQGPLSYGPAFGLRVGEKESRCSARGTVRRWSDTTPRGQARNRPLSSTA